MPEHLRYGKHGRVVDRAEGQLLLGGKNARLQPLLQGKILPVAAEKRHGGVAVRVAEGGHQQISPAVHHLFRPEVRVLPLPHAGNLPVPDAHADRSCTVAVFRQERCVLQQYFHIR